jgi:predicted metalloprotease with PDZ domain
VRIDLGPGESVRKMQLPVWNALYQVRDFAQFVNWVRATGPSGTALEIGKIDKTTWQFADAEEGATVEYEIFADQSGPYGAQINDHHAFFNLAEVLMYPVGERATPVKLHFIATPPTWKFATALTQSGEWFEAENYDRLVDSPVEIGIFQESNFDDTGGHYRVVVDADPSDFDMQKLVLTVHKIVAAAVGWMEDRPFQTYTFLYHFPRGPGGGGMEHAYSTAIELNAQSLREDPALVEEVSAHEFFHLWNVKRIRPQSLEPIDYTRENYTTALWFSEGVTSAAADFILLRAGLLDEVRFAARLGQVMTELERRPAHLTQSAEESSLDAWLEKYSYYRQPDRSISYYNKGELLGLMLDLALRNASHDTASLRELFQWMNRNYAQQSKFFPDSAGVHTAAEAVSHGDLKSFFQNYVAGTDEIRWNDFLAVVGLRAERHIVSGVDLGFAAARNFDAPPSVIRVRPGSDAERAGLMVGDTIDQINGRTAGSDFQLRLGELHPGETLRLRVRSRLGEGEIRWKVGSMEQVEFVLRDVDNVTVQQKARRAAWLKGESQLIGVARP